jgi:hypothetical protein
MVVVMVVVVVIVVVVVVMVVVVVVVTVLVVMVVVSFVIYHTYNLDLSIQSIYQSGYLSVSIVDRFSVYLPSIFLAIRLSDCLSVCPSQCV